MVCPHAYDEGGGCPDCLDELYRENVDLRRRVQDAEEKLRAVDPPDLRENPHVDERYKAREVLQMAVAHLDPDGPHDAADRAGMAQYVRFYLKKDERLWGYYLRPHLRYFAQLVEKTLRGNEWKGDWRAYGLRDVLEMLADELDEVDLALALRDRDLLRLELRDVAALCMMAWYLAAEVPRPDRLPDYVEDGGEVRVLDGSGEPQEAAKRLLEGVLGAS